VSKFQHHKKLCSKFSISLDSERNVAWCNMIEKILKSRAISKTVKIKIYTTIVKLIVTHGSET
jgi:hypothetical protein